MKGLALALLLAAAAAAAEEDFKEFPTVESAAVLPEKETKEKEVEESAPPKCVDRCTGQYGDEFLQGRKGCHTGCTLLSIIEAIDLPPGQTDFTNTLASCKKSCDASFSDHLRSSACNLGCAYQVPASVYRRKNMPKESGHPVGLVPMFPRFRIGFAFPSSSPFGGEGGHGMPDLSGVFDSMRRQMDGMMNRMRSMMGSSGGGRERSLVDSMMSDMMRRAQDMEDGEGPEGMAQGSRGSLTVVKSGPGYHEEKTYNFGPEGVETHSRSSGVVQPQQDRPMGPDMMDVMNPLERYFNSHDVEVVDKDDDDDSFAVPGFDIDGPRLPGEGLKSRFLDERRRNPYLHSRDGRHGYPQVTGPYVVGREDICSRDSHSMKWSDWVSCLHLRMGLPRWLTAATVSLGVVFAIWLCLVIPHSAPKQRVRERRRQKAAEAAGRLEEAYLTAPPGLVAAKLDLPPAYDDVARLHVAVPAGDGAQEEAGPLPEKKPLPEEEGPEKKV